MISFEKFIQTVKEVLLAVIPIVAVVLFTYLFILRVPAQDIVVFLTGVLFAIVGMVIFLIGVENSLLPIGELIGASLMTQGTLWILLGIGFSIGFSVTLAEPGVMVLASQVERTTSGDMQRYLMAITVAIGVGIFVVLALLKTVLNISFSKLITTGYITALVLTYFAPSQFLSFAFDFSGATTGPVTVPFLLALGVGATAVVGSRGKKRESFGYVALASIGPIISILIMGLFYG